MLSDDEEEEEYTIKEKIPPIIVDTGRSFSSVMKLIGSKYTFKRMSVGTKILSYSLLLYDEALKVLKNCGFHFYTHEVKASKSFKMVLFGLPQDNF